MYIISVLLLGCFTCNRFAFRVQFVPPAAPVHWQRVNFAAAGYPTWSKAPRAHSPKMLRWTSLPHALARRARLHRGRSCVSCCDDEELPSYEVTLKKPFGLALEERTDGCMGLVVTECLGGGSAAEYGSIWPGDLLLEVCGRDVSGMEFDNAMAVLIDAPEQCDLTFGRERGKMAALRFFPDQPLVFAQPGEPIMPLAQQAGFDVEYNCKKGSCGSCAMFLRDGESEDEIRGMKPVRLCKTRVPMGSQASLLPWDVLRPDSPQAKAYNRMMEEKYASKKKKQGAS